MLSLARNQFELSPHYVDHHTVEEHQILKEDIKVRGFIYPLLINEDRLLINGYLRWRIANELNIPVLPIVTCFLGVSDSQIQTFFLLSKNSMHNITHTIDKIKYLSLLYPHLFVLRMYIPDTSITELYENASQEIGISVRQLQRDRKIYLLAQRYATKGKRKYILDNDIIKAVNSINEKRRNISLQDNKGKKDVLDVLKKVYYSQDEKHRKSLRKKVKKLIQEYK